MEVNSLRGCILPISLAWEEETEVEAFLNKGKIGKYAIDSVIGWKIIHVNSDYITNDRL